MKLAALFVLFGTLALAAPVADVQERAATDAAALAERGCGYGDYNDCIAVETQLCIVGCGRRNILTQAICNSKCPADVRQLCLSTCG